MLSRASHFESQRGVVFESGGEQILAILFVPSEEGKRPAVILCNGFPGIEKNYDLAERLRESGFYVLMIHYRGSWGSDGSYGFLNIPEDIVAALDFVETVEGVDAKRVGLIGYSLGGWGSIVVASEDSRPRCVVALAALSDLNLFGPDSVVRNLSGDFKFVKGLTVQRALMEWQMMSAKFNPIEIVKNIAPRRLLIVHGDVDHVIDLEHAHRLYDKAGKPKALYIIRGGDHRFTGRRTLMITRITNWLKKNL